MDLEKRVAELERRLAIAEKNDAELTTKVIGLLLDDPTEDVTALTEGLFRLILVVGLIAGQVRPTAQTSAEELLSVVEAGLELCDVMLPPESGYDWRHTILTVFEQTIPEGVFSRLDITRLTVATEFIAKILRRGTDEPPG